MKKLVTHIRPHLDDICAMWLLKRYLPEAKDAVIGFVPTNERGGDSHDDAETVHVGVGRGMFDEHKGDVGECATTLVFKHVNAKVRIEDRERRAVEKIVEWVRLEDTGRLNALPHRSFMVKYIIEGRQERSGSDEATTEFGFGILDDLLVMQRNEVAIEDAWAGRRVAITRYGKTVALSTGARQIDAYAYAQGFPLVVIVDPARTYHTVRADAASDIDLTPVFEKLKQVDPGASWYFHHSKKMLICGGDHSPQATPSKLSLDELVALLQ